MNPHEGQSPEVFRGNRQVAEPITYEGPVVTTKALWATWTGDPMQDPELVRARREKRQRRIEADIMHAMAMKAPAGASTTRFDPTAQVASVTQSELDLSFRNED